MNGRKPAGLPQDHVEVVGILQIEGVFPESSRVRSPVPQENAMRPAPSPRKIRSPRRLPKMPTLSSNGRRLRRKQRIAGIDRTSGARHAACEAWGPAASHFAAILDVVMNEHWRLCSSSIAAADRTAIRPGLAPKRARGSRCRCSAASILPARLRVIGQRFVQMPCRVATWKIARHLPCAWSLRIPPVCQRRAKTCPLLSEADGSALSNLSPQP